MVTLKQIELDLNILRESVSQKQLELNKFIELSREEEQELLRQKNIILNGSDIEKVMNAERFIEIEGFRKYYGDENPTTVGCLDEAIADAASGFKALRERYFGCKNYDRWVCQRCDADYGYGPKHGYIVFRIELKPEWRKEIEIKDSDVEDILYYLNKLKNKEFRDSVDTP